MLFNSIVFLWIFLPILIALYFTVGKIFPKTKNYILLIFSLLFYAWGEPKYIVLMLVSIVINYIFGLLIAKYAPKGRGENKKRDKRQIAVLVISILTNLALLGHFKYANFFVDSINNVFGANFNIGAIALPIGISFYTFQIMSYIIDLYRGEIKVQKNLFKLALYISFFPQLIAGPIVKYHDIDKALSSRKETMEKFAVGAKRFIYGLAKKVLIADVMAAVVDAIFSYQGGGVYGLTQPVAWLGAICYALQIFFDFSGYSDMAIGLGSMFGFKFMENFNLPYISGSITEFWRRWHISLSTWFKEYIYIPLGGNRKGKVRTYINLWVVFLATGIWHGAAWVFVLWGIYHGLFIFIERLGLKKLLDKMHVLNHVYTLLVVLGGWVIFRAPSFSYAKHYLKTMVFGAPEGTVPIQLYTIVNHRTVVTIIIGILFCGVIQVALKKISESKKYKKSYARKARFCTKYVEPVVLLTLFALCIMAIISNTYTSFIYFRF